MFFRFAKTASTLKMTRRSSTTLGFPYHHCLGPLHRHHHLHSQTHPLLKVKHFKIIQSEKFNRHNLVRHLHYKKVCKINIFWHLMIMFITIILSPFCPTHHLPRPHQPPCHSCQSRPDISGLVGVQTPVLCNHPTGSLHS